MQSITYTIEIKWKIKGFDNYGFGTDKNLYNLKTGRKLKQTYNAGSIGYWLGKTFKTIHFLREIIYKPKFEYCPF